MMCTMRLLGSIAFEFFAGIFFAVAFLFRRRRAREMVRDLMVRKSLTATLSAVALILAVSAGCSSRPHPGTSFDRQIDELSDSARTLWSMNDAQESLEDDLADFGGGTSFKDAASDIQEILSSPDAQESLEDDLTELGTLEEGQLKETLDMLGW